MIQHNLSLHIYPAIHPAIEATERSDAIKAAKVAEGYEIGERTGEFINLACEGGQVNAGALALRSRTPSSKRKRLRMG